MTAPIGTVANRFSGIRELGQVTNSYAGYLQSAGVAYDITLPFQADCFQWYRYTTYGTAGTIGQGIWFRDFPAGDMLSMRAIADNGGTGLLNLVLDTSGGVTIANDAGGFVDQHLAIGAPGIVAAVVTTSTAHGLSDSDRVMITQVVGTVGPEVNNQSFVVDVLSSTTFALYDVYGSPIVQVGTWTSGGQVTKEGPRLGIENVPITYKLTLGATVMGADNDVIYFIAWKFNSYYNLGDVA